MPTALALSTRCCLLALAALLGACASAPPQPSPPRDMPARFAWVLDSLDRATTVAERETPRVRLVTRSGIDQWVDATFQMTGDGYLMVVALDLDGVARVLYPQETSADGFVRADDPRQHTRFFAGFGSQPFGRTSYASFTGWPGQLASGRARGAGIIVAVASDRPLQLERLMDATGEWDALTIRSLLEDRNAATAAWQLGRALSLAGQEFSVDSRVFNGEQGQSFAFASLLDQCGRRNDAYPVESGFGSGFAQLLSTRFVLGQEYARFAVLDVCGRVIGYREVPAGPSYRRPDDSTHVDTSATTIRSAAARGSSGRRISVTAERELSPNEKPATPLRFRSPAQLIRDNESASSGMREDASMLRRAPSAPSVPMRPADRAEPRELSRPAAPVARVEMPERSVPAPAPPRVVQSEQPREIRTGEGATRAPPVHPAP